MIETMRWIARRAWCEKCMDLVGPPRTTVREALVDLRAHRKAGHPKPTSSGSTPKGGDASS